MISYVVLVPSHFCVFPKLKEFMKGKKVSDDENIICMANGWLLDQEQFFYNGMRTLEKPRPSAFQLQENMSKSDKI